MKDHQIVVSQWLEKIGRERDVTLLLDDDGHCIIPCTNGLNCVVEVPADLEVPAVFIYLPLVHLTGNPAAQLTQTSAALEMNLFGLLTGGCQIALDTRSSYLVLSFSAMIDAINDKVFQHILSDMLERAPDLRDRLQKLTNRASVSSELLLSSQVHHGRFTP